MKTFIFANTSENSFPAELIKEIVIKANSKTEALEKLKEQVTNPSDYKLVGSQG